MNKLATHTGSRRAIVYLSLLAFTLSPTLPALADESVTPQSLRDRFDQVLDLIAAGQYLESETILQEIIAEYQGSNLSQAYDLLVWTVKQERGRPAAIEVAREALELYPDLTNDRVNVPREIGELYDELRSEMFGALQIEAANNDLQDSPVWLNGEMKGVLPLYLDLVRAGEYELKVSASGYEDHVSMIQISPDRDTVIPINLNKKGGNSWLWIGAGAVAAAVTATALSGGDDPPTQGADPLAGPPDPPGP
jgi:hypothetical protein